MREWQIGMNFTFHIFYGQHPWAVKPWTNVRLSVKSIYQTDHIPLSLLSRMVQLSPNYSPFLPHGSIQDCDSHLLVDGRRHVIIRIDSESVRKWRCSDWKSKQSKWNQLTFETDPLSLIRAWMADWLDFHPSIFHIRRQQIQGQQFIRVWNRCFGIWMSPNDDDDDLYWPCWLMTSKASSSFRSVSSAARNRAINNVEGHLGEVCAVGSSRCAHSGWVYCKI